MSPLAVARVVQLALLLPVVVTGAWSWYRYSAPLLLDSLDADEMIVGAVHKLSTATYLLLAVGAAGSLRPDRRDLSASVLGNWAAFVLCLGIAQGLALGSLLRRRRRREASRFSPRVWGPPPTPPAPAFGVPPGYSPSPMAAPCPVPTYAGPFFVPPPLYATSPNPYAWPPTPRAPSPRH